MKGTTLTAVTLTILYLTTPSVLSIPLGRIDTIQPWINPNLDPDVSVSVGNKREISVDTGVDIHSGNKQLTLM
ncbi:hypothetical protein C1645_822127 [Glomus cerebriforme]|uniref:Uncharacterized protein n=1 Tax=Glomus cerebriforme TaxID=658196 RepID=A0A397T3F7_9GLOM|nr:hypothetical protein C1645_822127 [Glomus cerebriforme]